MLRPLSTEFDRADSLQALDARHEALLVELDQLNREIEAALAAARPDQPVFVEGLDATRPRRTISAGRGVPTC